MTVTITATPQPLGDPCPSVLLDLAGLTGSTMSVFRNQAGARKEVRGYTKRLVVGDAYTLIDFEAPFGIPISYDVECYNVAGATINTGTLADVLLECRDAWISDALAPTLSTRVTLTGTSLATATLRRDGGTVPIVNAAYPTGQGGVRRKGAAIPIAFRCENEAEESAVLEVVCSADPLVLRTPADHRQLPRLAYVTTSEWVVDIPPQGGGAGAFSFIRGTVDLVVGPGASVIVPARTYGDVLTEGATYGDIRASRASYLYVLRG